MPGPNTSNTPKTSDYVVGRGEVYAALLDANDLPSAGWLHLGNCPDFSQNVTIEKLEHFSSMNGLKTLDLSVIIQQAAKLSFALEEFNEFNLSQFLKGTITTFTNPAVAGFAEIDDHYVSVTLGRWYDLTDSSSVRCYDISDKTKILLEKNAGTDVTLVEGTDYELDTIWGRFRLLPAATHIATGDNVNLTITAGASATSTIRRIQGLQSVGARYAVKFIFKNAANSGKQLHVEYHKVSLDPSGDLSMISSGNQNAQMKFDCGCEESDATIYANSPTVDIDWHANA
jgi:hypothetical protein